MPFGPFGFHKNSGIVEKTFGQKSLFQDPTPPKLISTNSVLRSLDSHLVWTHHRLLQCSSKVEHVFLQKNLRHWHWPVFYCVNLSYPGSCSSFGYPKVYIPSKDVLWDICFFFGPLDQNEEGDCRQQMVNKITPLKFNEKERQNWWFGSMFASFSQACSGSMLNFGGAVLQGFEGGRSNSTWIIFSIQ